MKLTGQVAIVTGGGRGIGRGIARALAAEGAHVVVCARTEGEVQSVAEEIRAGGGSASAVTADVSQAADARRCAEIVLERYDRADILVNNAGIGTIKPVMDLSVEEFDRMWGVNVRGVFLMTKAFLPAMVKAKGGAIVNIASLAGKNSFKGGAGYGATKWALRGFAGSLMLEVRDHNIRVVTIFPGSVETSFSPAGKKGENIPRPEDIGAAVVFAVSAPSRAMFSEIDVRPTRP
jgi:NAD(P)-dependent dehydrogenase (short-subunit alcohol dehydrogenase family)